jgi:hypothetical protein
MSQRWFPALAALLIVVFVASCSGGATPAVPTAAPAPTQASVATQAPKPTTPPAAATVAPTAPAKPTAPAAAPTSAPAKATAAPGTKAPFTRAQLDKIFPPGKGQDLVFQACNNCHNWVPLLIAQLNKDSWLQNKGGHRERVSGLSDADYNFLYDYLIANVNDKTPIPDNIPQELLDQWTSY